MALRKINNRYYVYFRSPSGKTITKALDTSDETAAKRRERALLGELRVLRTAIKKRILHNSFIQSCVLQGYKSKLPANLQELDAIGGMGIGIPPSLIPHRSEQQVQKEKEPEPVPIAIKPIDNDLAASHAVIAVNGETLMEMDKVLDTARKYRKISYTHELYFNSFKRFAGVKYINEVTRMMVFNFLDAKYGNGNGKSFNNARTCLRIIFQCCMVETGMKENPAEFVMRRRVEEEEHFRPLTLQEFTVLFPLLPEPWKTLAIISWHTGMRRETCCKLSWKHINTEERSITIMPGKTARYNRSVHIPIHKELWAWLNKLERPEKDSDPIISAFGKFDMKNNPFRLYLDQAGIHDTEEGIVGFPSIRDSFVTRCDEAKIERHATRGIVGHVDDDMTDLYSHDYESAKAILDLPGLGLFD